MTGVYDAIGLPQTTHFYVTIFCAMLALAGLDFAGAIFAKEWAERHHAWLFVAGWLLFSVLFAVCAKILEVAELSYVTFGWVVFLQVGLLVIDRVRYDVPIPPAKLAAMALILVLQAFLILGPNGSSGDDAAATRSPAPARG